MTAHSGNGFFRLAIAAAVFLFLPICGGCKSSKHKATAYPLERAGARLSPEKVEPASPREEAYASFSAAVALDLEASHLEELYTYQNLSAGFKQASLLRDARRLRMRALAYLDRALERDPNSSDAIRHKGDVLLQLGNAEQAMKEYQKAEATGRAEPQWYFRMAGQLEVISRFADAAEVLKWAAQKAGGVPDDLRVVAFVEMGSIYTRLDRLDDAQQAYLDALTLAATHPRPTGSALGEAFTSGLEHDPTAIRRTLIGLLRRRGKLDEALAQAQTAVKDAPNDARAVLALSGVYQARGEPGSAIGAIERFLADNPKSDVGMYALINALGAAGRVDEAIARGKAFMAEKGAGPTIAQEIIAIYKKAGRTAEAEQFALSLEKDGKLDQGVALALLDLYLGEKRSDEAYALATRILENAAGDARYGYDVFGMIANAVSREEAAKYYAQYDSTHSDDTAASYGYAKFLRKVNETEKAADVFVTLAGKHAPFAEVYEAAVARLIEKDDLYGAGTVLLDGVERGYVEHPERIIGQIIDAAKKPAELAEKIEQDAEKYKSARIPFCQIVARLYGQAEENAKAEVYYRKALESPQPSLADYAGLAVSLYRQDKNAEAIELVTKLRKEGQGAPPLQRMLIAMLSKDGKFEEARDMALDLIREQPMDVDSRISLANVYIEHGDYEAARVELSTASDLAEGDTSAVLNVQYLLGVVYEEGGKEKEAVAAWRANLKTDPNDADSNNALAYHFAEKGGNLDEAVTLVEKALAAQPENEAYLDTLGWVYYKKGDVKKALEVLIRAAQKGKDAVILDHLGDARMASGDAPGALEAWRQALAGKPKDKDRARIEEKIKNSETSVPNGLNK